MRVRFAALTLFALFAVLCPASRGEESTLYVARLQQEAEELRSLCGEVIRFVNSGTTDRVKIQDLGVRIERQIASLRGLVVEYKNATTRFGLQHEYNLMEEVAVQAGFLGKAYSRLSGVPPKPASPEQVTKARDGAARELREMAVDLVTRRLCSQGAADILTSGSFEEAARTASQQLVERVLVDLNGELAAYVDVGWGAGGLELTARDAARRLLKKYIGKLLVKVTSKAFVIEFVTGAIINWVGPKLKEALRPKGNLDERVARSKEVLRDAGLLLDRFEGKASVQAVRLGVELAERAIDSTMFLVQDLSRARREDLIGEMKTAIERLQQIIKRTRYRFLIGSEIGQKALTDFISLLDLIAGDIKAMRTNAAPGERDPIGPPDAPPESSKDAVAGTYEVLTTGTLQVSADTRSRVVLTGNMSELAFEFKLWDDRWGFADNGRSWHFKGSAKWVGGEAGAKRTLRGPCRSQWSANAREDSAVISIERDHLGVWRACQIDIGGNRFGLGKSQSARMR